MKRLPKILTAFTLGAGCSSPPAVPDAGPQDAGQDAGVSDAGLDAGYDAGVSDAGVSDAGVPDAGTPDSDGGMEMVMCPPAAPPHDAGAGTPWGDAGCVLPSDFPWDAGFAASLADSACACTFVPSLHCFEENGPRCFSWACPPAATEDGGYECMPDGGLVCLC
jgi:hypothetical protein